MSGRKSNLRLFQTITSGDMSQASVTSAVTNIQMLDNIGVQLNWTGSPDGTFEVQVSADYYADTFGNVENPGNWTSLTLSSPPTTAGGSPIYIDITETSAPWLRVVFNSDFVESADIATVADVAGSLNSKYFLLNGADGTNWYIWLNNGAGVNPSIPSRTGIAVSYTTGDSANAIATAIRSALAACTSITTIGGSTNHVTFVQDSVGHGSLTQGTPSTGFTLGYTSGSGTLQGYITGKMI